MRQRAWFALLVTLLAALPASAVIIASGDGTGNTSEQGSSFGFANVGTIGGLSAIYLGGGWVLTAAHVGVGDVVLDGRRFAARSGSELRLTNPDGSLADLVAFELEEHPDLPALAVAKRTPAPGSKLWLAGHGRNRGEAAEWYGRPGWLWGPGQALRWGTNVVSGTDARIDASDGFTRTFYSDFSLPGTLHEAQAAGGDSGGAVFAASADGPVLAGVIVAIHAPFQPAETALDGNLTHAADLAFYRAQLEAAGVVPPVAGDDVGEPVIHVGAERVFLGVLRVGDARVVRVPVANRGSAPLHLRAVSLAPGGSRDYRVEPAEALPLELAPPADDPAGAVTSILVRLAPSKRGWHLGRLVIESDDPRQPRVEIRLVGYAYGGWKRFFHGSQ